MRNKKRWLGLALSVFIAGAAAGCGSENVVHRGEPLSIIDTQSDSQSYWSTTQHKIAKGEQVYYLLESPLAYGSSSATPSGAACKGYLSYIDEMTMNKHVLCNKEGCTHRDVDCMAYLDSTYGNSIYYYEGNLYLYRRMSDNQVYLYKIDTKTYQSDRLFSVGEADNELGNLHMAFCKGSVYVYRREGSADGINEDTAALQRYALDGSGQEMIYTHTAIGAEVCGVKVYGDKVFFLDWEVTKDNPVKYKGLFVYDTSTGTVQTVSSKNVCDYTVDVEHQNLYYYVAEEGLYRQQLQDGTYKKVYAAQKGQTELCRISYDGTYLYMDNKMQVAYREEPKEYALYVCDADGNVLTTMNYTKDLSVCFGDAAYLFATENNTVARRIAYIKKSEILTQKEWTVIY